VEHRLFLSLERGRIQVIGLHIIQTPGEVERNDTGRYHPDNKEDQCCLPHLHTQSPKKKQYGRYRDEENQKNGYPVAK
jgi:hypothetical protein